MTAYCQNRMWSTVFESSRSHVFICSSRKSVSYTEYENYPSQAKKQSGFLPQPFLPSSGDECCSLLSLHLANEPGPKQYMLLQ